MVGTVNSFFFCHEIFSPTDLQVHMTTLDGDLTAKMKLHSLKIKDELQGRLSTNPQYLACSVLENDGVSEKDMSTVLLEDDDNFADALPEFLSSTEGIVSPKKEISQSGMIRDIGDTSESESSGALICNEKLVQGKGITDEIFYEAEGGDSSDFVSVAFSTRSPTSNGYDGIDMQVIYRSIMTF